MRPNLKSRITLVLQEYYPDYPEIRYYYGILILKLIFSNHKHDKCEGADFKTEGAKHIQATLDRLQNCTYV